MWKVSDTFLAASRYGATVLKIDRTGIYLKPHSLYLNFIVKYYL